MRRLTWDEVSGLASRVGLGGLARSHFVRDGLLVFAATILTNALNYALHFAVSRRLGVDGYGELSSVLGAITLASIPLAMISLAVARYASEFRALVLGRDESVGLFTKRVALAMLGLAVLVVLGTLVFLNPIAHFLRIGDAGVIFAAGITLAGACISCVGRGALQGLQDFSRYAGSLLIEGAAKMILGVGLVYAGYGVYGAMLGYALGALVAAAYSAFAIRQFVLRPRVVPFNVRHIVRMTGGIALMTAGVTSLGFTDIVLVKHFLNAQDAGLYSAASLLGKIILFAVSFVATIVLPKASSDAARGVSPVPLLKQAALAAGSMSAVALLLVWFAAPLLVRIVTGPAFSAAAPYAFPYCVASVCLAGTSIATAYKVGIHTFDFVPLLVAAALGEIVGICLFHGSIWQVVTIIMIGHAVAFAGSVYRITRPRRFVNLVQIDVVAEQIAEHVA